MIMLFEQEESVKRYGNRRAAEGREEGKIATLSNLVTKGMITIETAAQELGMTVDQFKEAVDALKETA